MGEMLARVVDHVIDEAEVRDAVEGPDAGAVVMFHGVVRNHDGGERVTALDYSHDPNAQEFLARVVAEEHERTGVRVAAVHRVGSLAIGDAALVASAASAHRREAFAAIEALVERIKHEVPIWKRQHFEAGASEWVGL